MNSTLSRDKYQGLVQLGGAFYSAFPGTRCTQHPTLVPGLPPSKPEGQRRPPSWVGLTRQAPGDTVLTPGSSKGRPAPGSGTTIGPPAEGNGPTGGGDTRGPIPSPSPLLFPNAGGTPTPSSGAACSHSHSFLTLVLGDVHLHLLALPGAPRRPHP